MTVSRIIVSEVLEVPAEGGACIAMSAVQLSVVVVDIPVSDCSRATPRYTVKNCFGRDRNAAIENVQMLIPHVEKTAVVTKSYRVSLLGQQCVSITYNVQESH